MMRNSIVRSDTEFLRLLYEYVSVLQLANAGIVRSNRQLAIAPSCPSADMLKLIYTTAVHTAEAHLSEVQKSLRALQSFIENNHKWAVDRAEDREFHYVVRVVSEPNAVN